MRSHDQVLDETLSSGTLRTLFQPIIDLDSQAVVGFEALTRGPVGSPLESAPALFGTADRCGRTAELDALCLSTAASTLASSDVGAVRVFLNVEPSPT